MTFVSLLYRLSLSIFTRSFFPDSFMSHINRLLPVLNRFQRNDWPALPNRTNNVPSAVLVPLLCDAQWTCLLTQRTASLRAHAGEICFPGGKPDPEDLSLEHTALREAKEELALTQGHVIAELSSVPLYTSEYRIYPFLALFPEDTPIRPNRDEVAHLLSVSLVQLLSLPYLDGVPFEYYGKKYTSPIFDLTRIGIDIEQKIYGGTAHVLYETLQITAQALHIEIPPTRDTYEQFPFNHAST